MGSWEDWIDLPCRVGDAIARHLVGAEPGEVVVGDSTTVCLYRAAEAAVAARPGAVALVTDDDNFPTDRYVLEGVAAPHGLEYREVASDPVAGPDPAALAPALDGAALLCLSHVAYRSGALADMAGLTRLAHDHGALALWDLSPHGGRGARRPGRPGADLAVGCGYKYLNGGPGAPAFIYVRRDRQAELRPPIWGWFGQRDQFGMGPGYDPAEGIGAWLAGTPAVLGLVCVEEGVGLLAEAGIDRLRAKGMALTALAVDLADAWLAPLGFTPGQPPGRRPAGLARGAGPSRRRPHRPGAAGAGGRRPRLPGARPHPARARRRSPAASWTCGMPSTGCGAWSSGAGTRRWARTPGASCNTPGGTVRSSTPTREPDSASCTPRGPS